MPETASEKAVDFRNKETMSEYEICPHCLMLGKTAQQSIHLHQDIARSSIDHELICLTCYSLQEKPNYRPPEVSALLEARKKEISTILDEFFRQKGESLDRMDYL